MLTESNSEEELTNLTEALTALVKNSELTQTPPAVAHAERAIPLNECIYLPVEKVKADDSLGRICGSINISCPPAVPVVVAGEIIGESQLELLKYYGVEEVEVIKE